MIKWALETLYQAVDDELSALGPIMQFPQDDLSEEALPGIYLQDTCSSFWEHRCVIYQMHTLSDAHTISDVYFRISVISDKYCRKYDAYGSHDG
jgi:hypothetical protein